MEKVDFNSLIDHNSILVINQKGSLRKLYCPFRVLCVESISNIQKGTWYYIDRVKEDPRTKIHYCIGDIEYPYRNFHIYIMF